MFSLVTGTGYTGRRILNLLPPDSALGLSRSNIQTDHATHVLDLDSAAVLPFELPTHYAVVYTVPPKGEPPDRRLERLFSMLAPAPVRFVYISTTGVYGDCGGKTVTEEAPLRPSNERSSRRVAAEALLAEWAERVHCELVILRVPGIYGPGRLGIERIQSQMPVLAEEFANPGNRIHVDDLALCCVAAISDRMPAGIYNVGDGDHRSATWFAEEVARQANLPSPPAISREAAHEQFSKQRLSFMADSRRVDTTKMRDVLKVALRYADPADGIAASL